MQPWTRRNLSVFNFSRVFPRDHLAHLTGDSVKYIMVASHAHSSYLVNATATYYWDFVIMWAGGGCHEADCWLWKPKSEIP